MTTWLGSKRVHLDECGSTNDEILALARAGAPHGTGVTAGAQTAGRGRAGRAWHSPPGANLYLSALLRVTAAPAITLAAGIAVCDAVRAAGVAAARLKWPNDVLVGDRKLAGILAEASAGTIVLGIGVDVDGRRADLPPELAAIATSIRDELGAPQDVAAFATLLIETLEPWLDRFLAGGVPAIAADWEARADLARRVRTGTGSGIATGLAPDGGLRIRLDDGREQVVVAGDVLEIARP
jgi:BirA family biotin operon repressor/biotin-[acetyl-CoA-carboxylase] ligase